ncbi:hypothetical protein [Kitasatospora sp. NPDC088779]|uniref:hypothetical protein n=1 Tax=unclassified Kitasatospora TaxID=2633591 RepID=UPI003449D30C
MATHTVTPAQDATALPTPVRAGVLLPDLRAHQHPAGPDDQWIVDFGGASTQTAPRPAEGIDRA